MRPFQATGYWFLPEGAEAKVAGVLRYAPRSGAKLELFGTLGSLAGALEATTYPLIHGVVSESPYGRRFSLIDCFRSSLTMGMPGVTTEQVTANRLFVGSDYVPSKETEFAKTAVVFNHLQEWMNPRALTQEPITDDSGINGMRVIYRQGPAVQASVDGATLSLGTSARTSSDLHRVTITQECQLVISGFEPASHERINSSLIYPMQNFFTLATDTPNAIESLRLWLKAETTEKAQTNWPFHYLAQPVFVPADDHRVLQGSGDGLFFLSDIRQSLEEVLRAWLHFCDENEGFCHVYFGQIYAPPRFVETRFGVLVQSAALLFRESTEREGREWLREISNQLPKHASSDVAQWAPSMGFLLEGFLFPVMLRRAVETHWSLMQPLIRTTPQDFVRSVVDSLSYSVSRGKKPEHASTGVALYWLEKKLDVLLRAHLLSMLGLSEQSRSGFFQQNRNYQHLCRVSPEAE